MNKQPNPFEESPSWHEAELPSGRMNLPRPGERTLFCLKECFINGHHIPKGFMVYGYRYIKEGIYLPGWRARLSVTLIMKWKEVAIDDSTGKPFPLYWNGSGRSEFECFED